MLNTVPTPHYCVERNKAIIYFYSSLTDDWRCDQYRWANQGVRRLPKREPQVKKSYFHIDTPKGPSSNFVKDAYQLVAPSNTSTVLIHYIGDEKEVVDFPHGNASNQAGRPHIRTCPSVLKSLQDACKHTTTAKAYKSHVTKVPPPTHMPVLQPRNSKQVKNIRSKQLQKQRLSHDALYNLHELAVDLPDFVHAIRTHPDLVCICCSMSWIVCFWYSPLHPSCCHMTQLFNWVIFMYQHLLSDTLCSRKPQLFQLPSLYMKESCRHAMMSCLAFAASLCPP